MRCILSSILGILLVTHLAASPNVKTGAAPSWLYPNHPDLAKKPVQRDINDGYYYELFEQQVNLLNNTDYHHFIKHIVNESGVQNGSEVSVTFAPEFQQVVFHRITIQREGESLSQLQPGEIKVVQEETDADDFQYNGLKRAFITLKDVRKGDRIEVAYSIVGLNPVFGKKYSDEFYFSSSTAICNYYESIITTPDRKLNIQLRNNAPAPVEQHLGNTLVYHWDNPALTTWETKTAAPSWYNNYPAAFVTEYNNWSEVINWALSIFNHYHYPLPEGLLHKIDGWKAIAKDNKDLFANLATRFVQNDIRYLGLEIGPNTHQPHAPASVFGQRFGDCKDKALLLAAILQHQGIPAYVALVNTDIRSKLTETSPSPSAFDHAIVALERSKDHYQYIDPTLSGQRGELADLYVPAYGYALVLRDSLSGLLPINPGRVYDYFITEQLDARYYDSSSLSITSTYKGGTADEVRNMFEENSMRDLEEKYRKFYATQLDNIRQSAPITYTDDSLRNELTVYKHYVIPQLWNTSEKGKKSFDYAVKIISGTLPDPSDANGETPLALTYPFHAHYTLDLTLPENWDFGNGELHIKNDDYQFDFTPSTNGKNMVLRYSLTTFKDHIPAAAVKQYKSDYKNIADRVFFQLYKNNSDISSASSEEETTHAPASAIIPSGPGFRACWPAIWLTFFFSLLFSRLFIFLNRRSEDTFYSPGSGYPLGGWLILLGISFAFTIMTQLFQLYQSNYYSYANWITVGKTGGTSLQYLYLTRLAIHLSFLTGAGATLFWFLKRRDIFPRMFIWYAGLLLTGRLLLLVLFRITPTPASFNGYKDDLTMEFLRTCVYAAIWVAYVLRSGQVRSTFLEPGHAETD
jgi:hypothetical protein